MKCPKCGFVSYAGLEQCKKCGYPFVKAAVKGPLSPPITPPFEGVRITSSEKPGPRPEQKENTRPTEPGPAKLAPRSDVQPPVPVAVAAPKLPPPTLYPERTTGAPGALTDASAGSRRGARRPGPDLPAQQPSAPAASMPTRIAAPQSSLSGSTHPHGPEPAVAWIKELSEGVENYRSGVGLSRRGDPAQDWREELSERLDNFRKRRARLQPDAPPLGNLELDFQSPDKDEFDRFMYGALDSPGIDESAFDLDIDEPVGREDQVEPARETLTLEPLREDLIDEKLPLDAVPFEEEVAMEGPAADRPPMEILVDSPPIKPMEEGEGVDGIYLATLGRRFLAGLTDAVVLLAGAGLFGLIFWRFCGHLSPVPLNIVVLGLVAIILIFAYFGVFTAIASATPGLLWLGCEIRNLQGEHPSVSESCWRAFGILVSLAAFMLGFLWACVDSGSMTWHDRMSGTVITEASNVPGLADVRAEG